MTKETGSSASTSSSISTAAGSTSLFDLLELPSSCFGAHSYMTGRPPAIYGGPRLYQRRRLQRLSFKRSMKRLSQSFVSLLTTGMQRLESAAMGRGSQYGLEAEVEAAAPPAADPEKFEVRWYGKNLRPRRARDLENT
jgi:hypothetical protein